MSATFAYEEDLCAVLALNLNSVLLPGSNPLHVRALEQRPIGNVVPDFIYIRSDRLSSPSTSEGLTSIESSIVAAVASCEGLCDEAIAQRVYSTVERITPRLRALEHSGVLRRSRDGVLVLRRGALPRAVHVIAVEAKLRRWREAVSQAEAYLSFANQSYVALPELVVRDNLALRELALARRIGILAVNADGVSISKAAPRHQTRSADWIWLLSRTIQLARH